MTGNTEIVGWLLYTDYLVPFELASMLLLVAMIGAILLARREVVMLITPYHYLVLSAALFTIGVIGVMLRRNIIIVFMSIELMLNAVNINLAAFSHYWQSAVGQVFAIFVIAVAAAEAAVGLGHHPGVLPEQGHAERRRDEQVHVVGDRVRDRGSRPRIGELRARSATNHGGHVRSAEIMNLIALIPLCPRPARRSTAVSASGCFSRPVAAGVACASMARCVRAVGWSRSCGLLRAARGARVQDVVVAPVDSPHAARDVRRHGQLRGGLELPARSARRR